MTTLIAWQSMQNGKATALNFASDSRYTWHGSNGQWDGGRKLFWCKQRSDIFGYAGPVVTQSTLLSQLCDAIDHSSLDLNDPDSSARHEVFIRLCKTSLDTQINVQRMNMTTFHGTREGTGDQVRFRVWKTEFGVETESLDDQEIDWSISDKHPFVAAGSGAPSYRRYREENEKKYGATSRIAFKSLMDVIADDEFDSGDPRSGGPPQVISLSLEGSAKPVGIAHGSQRSLLGMALGDIGQGGDIDWRNEKYELLSSETLAVKSNAPGHVFW